MKFPLAGIKIREEKEPAETSSPAIDHTRIMPNAIIDRSREMARALSRQHDRMAWEALMVDRRESLQARDDVADRFSLGEFPE